MALAWFICGYTISANPKDGRMNIRTCAMDQFTPQIIAQDGGNWSEVEVLGSYALCKVSASTTTITAIGNTNGFYKVTDHAVLTDSLSDLTTPQRNAIQTRMLAMGYTQAEINATMGSTITLWRQKTFTVLLNFCAQRRVAPRFDTATSQIVFDGPFIPCAKTVAKVDTEVT
jgi:hypothetical protein